MNAAERLWDGLTRRNWDAVAAQFHDRADVYWPHTGERITRDEYVAVNRASPGTWDIEVRKMISNGRDIAVEAIVRGADETHRCAGFYDLHDGRIAHATEYWVAEGEQAPRAGRPPRG